MSSNADLSTDDLARPGVMRDEGDPGDGADDRGTRGTGMSLDEGSAGPDTERRSEEMSGPGTDGQPDRTVEDMPAGSGRDAGVRQDAGGGTPPVAVEQGSPAGGVDAAAGDVALVDPADGERFRQRWNDVQARFVDDPREAVQTADGLVAELMQSLARGFSEHKGRLESAWQSGEDPDTEELRQALQRYRSFFDRLLSA